ncbi:MAG: arginase family protein [Candidatus Fermentibacteria bacterium]
MHEENIKDHVIPAEDGVFYTRNDPNDIRFGDIDLRDIEQYSTAQVVILGCPQEEGVIEAGMFHEFGINSFANSPSYIDYVMDTGACIHFLGDLRSVGVGASLRSIIDAVDSDGIFFGFDLDVVRSMEAPGVSDPGPMGFSAREAAGRGQYPERNQVGLMAVKEYNYHTFVERAQPLLNLPNQFD